MFLSKRGYPRFPYNLIIVLGSGILCLCSVSSPDLISPSGSIPLNNYIPVDTARHFIQLPFLDSRDLFDNLSPLRLPPYQNYIHRSCQFLANRPLTNKRIEFSFESPLLSAFNDQEA